MATPHSDVVLELLYKLLDSEKDAKWMDHSCWTCLDCLDMT